MRIFHKAIVGCIAAVVLTLAAAVAEAGELRIALAEEPSAIDPHSHDSAANNIVRRHLFDSLVMTDAALRLLPAGDRLAIPGQGHLGVQATARRHVP